MHTDGRVRVRRCSVDAEDFPQLFEEAVAAFDTNGSGELDTTEVRDLFHALFHEQLGDAKFARAMLDVRKFANHKCELQFDALTDAMVYVATEYDLGAVPKASKAAHLTPVKPPDKHKSASPRFEAWGEDATPHRIPRGLKIASAMRRRVRSLNLARGPSSAVGRIVPMQS